MKIFDFYIRELMDEKWVSPELFDMVHDDLETATLDRILVVLAKVLDEKDGKLLLDAQQEWWEIFETVLDKLMDKHSDVVSDALNEFADEYVGV